MSRASWPLLALLGGALVCLLPETSPAGPDGDVDPRPEVPSLAPAWETSALERYVVTLVPGAFVRTELPFHPAGGSAASPGVVSVHTAARAALFIGVAPGRTRYVARDAEDRRWVVYELAVLDPASTPVLRRLPELPPGVRAVLATDGRLVLEGVVVGQDDYGTLRVLSAATQAVNRVQYRDPLPEP